MFNGFKQFISRGNVVDLAVGIVVGGAFTAVVNAFVKDLLTPLLGIAGAVPNFEGLAFTIHGSHFTYGDFFNTLISFIIDAAAIYFFVILPINELTQKLHHKGPPPDPTTKKCPFCVSEISILATRCPFCTSELQPVKVTPIK